MSDPGDDFHKRMRAMEDALKAATADAEAARRREAEAIAKAAAADAARIKTEEENKRLVAAQAAGTLVSSTPSAPLVYRPANVVAEEYFRTATGLKWTAPHKVELSRAQLPPGHMHATKLNKVKDAAAMPGMNTFSPLFYRFISQGQPLSKGKKLSEFDGADGSKLVVILAPSGAGKTRKVLEMLREKMGCYLSFRGAEDDKNPGSRALTSVLSELKTLTGIEDLEWNTAVVPKRDAVVDPNAGTNQGPNVGTNQGPNVGTNQGPDLGNVGTNQGLNVDTEVDPKKLEEAMAPFRLRRDAVHFAMRCVLAAYRLVFRQLEKKFTSVVGLRPPTITPQQWLLLQLFPEHFFGLDVFEMLALRLFKQCDPRAKESDSAFPLGTLPEGWTCAIDEAQGFGVQLSNPDSLGSQFAKLFAAKGHPSIRSLLSAVISGARQAMSRYPIVLGTGLSLAMEWKSVVTNTATLEGEFVFHDLPPLDFGEVKRTLVRLLECEADPLLDEVCEWLVGRPRFTTYFVQKCLEGSGRTVSQAMFGDGSTLPGFLKEMTDPNSSYERGPSAFFKKLQAVTTFTDAGGQVVSSSPFDSALMDTYWISLGLGERRAKTPALIEIGVGYALPGSGAVVNSAVKAESLILEAARRLRIDKNWEETTFDAVADDASALGKRFEYVAAQYFLDAFFGRGPLESSPLLGGGDLGKSLPQAFRGVWESPQWRCGRYAFSGAEAFPGVLLAALNPHAEVTRVWFPDNNAGPDAVAVVRDVSRTRVMLVLIQVKLVIGKINEDEAALRVDPSKMYHFQRGKPSGKGKGMERVIQGKAADLETLLKAIETRNIPVVRVLFSGAGEVGKLKTGMVKHSRGGTVHKEDLSVVVDVKNMKEVLGDKVTELINKLKA